jgi:Arc/MetJ family transcription regulator
MYANMRLGEIIMRTTITINDTVFRALKMRAAETDTNVSKLVEDAIKYQILEDLEDIEDANARSDEPSNSFDSLVAKFKAEGLL